jgi:hypothetical protein
MASGPEKAYSVLAFHETKSLLQCSDSFDLNTGRVPMANDIYRFLFVGFCEGQCVCPPAADTLHEIKTRIREACTNTDQEILHNVWQDVNIGLMLLEPLVALTLNFINDKLLFIKLFQLVFQLVRVL